MNSCAGFLFLAEQVGLGEQAGVCGQRHSSDRSDSVADPLPSDPANRIQDCRNATAADFFISATYWRTALPIARIACQASVALIQAFACRNLVYAQRNAGIFISLSRVSLNRRSTSTSFRSSPATKVAMLLSNWPVAAR